MNIQIIENRGQGENDYKIFNPNGAPSNKLIIESNEDFVWMSTKLSLDEHKDLMQKDEIHTNFNKFELDFLIKALQICREKM